jgi:four helix bundle protein
MTERLPYAKSFRELLAYQEARQLSRLVFDFTKQFPREEIYSLTDQIRRSSRSIGEQIAEAWAKRSYERHFLSKLTDADGEQMETQHWIEVALDCNYVTPEQARALTQKCERVGRLLAGMMDKSHLFCGAPNQVLREQGPEYFINSEE